MILLPCLTYGSGFCDFNISKRRRWNFSPMHSNLFISQWENTHYQHTHTQTECSYVDTYAGLLITLPPCFQITSSFAKPTLHDDCGGNTNPYYLTSWQYLLAHHCLSLAVYTIVLFPGVREFDALCTLYILFLIFTENNVVICKKKKRKKKSTVCVCLCMCMCVYQMSPQR